VSGLVAVKPTSGTVIFKTCLTAVVEAYHVAFTDRDLMPLNSSSWKLF